MRLIIVDDHSLFRSGLAAVFKSQPDFELVGEAGTIKDALALFETKRPDLVLLDVGLPDGSGLDAIPKFVHISPDVQIILLTIHASDENAFTAIRLGAKGFLLKDISETALLSALRRLRYGELAVSRATLSHFIDEALPLMLPRAERSASEVSLTMREIEVLAQLAIGGSNLEIARRLSISENTLKIHVHNVLHKLKLRNRQEAADFARRHGLGNIMLNPLKSISMSQ